MNIEFQWLDGQTARNILSEIRPVYAEVYAEPPYLQGTEDVEQFDCRFDQQSDRDGFRFVSAREGGVLIGFSYAFVMPAGRWWRGAEDEPPAEIMSVPKIALIELILKKKFRGRGIGKRLMVEALSDRPESVATLLARSDAPAMQMYLHLGWRRLGKVQSQPHWPATDALVFDLAAGLPAVTVR